MNPFCWNQNQENLILFKEDHQIFFSRNGRMITNLNSTGLPRIGTIPVSGIILNLHQDFHTKDTHLKPIMEWEIIFQVLGDSMFNKTKIFIILFSLFTIGIKIKIKTKILLWQGKTKNQVVMSYLWLIMFLLLEIFKNQKQNRFGYPRLSLIL